MLHSTLHLPQLKTSPDSSTLNATLKNRLIWKRRLEIFWGISFLGLHTVLWAITNNKNKFITGRKPWFHYSLVGKLQHAKTPGRFLGTAASPHLHGEAGFPLGPPPAVSLAAAAAPVALFSLSSSWDSHSSSPAFPSTSPSADSAEKSAAVLCLAQPGRRQKTHEKSRQNKPGDLINYIVQHTDITESHHTDWKSDLNTVI